MREFRCFSRTDIAFILIPSNGEDLVINAWNWHPTLLLLRSANLINDDLHDRLGTFGPDGRIVDAETANQIAQFLDEELALIKPGDRIRADLTITDKPKELLVITPGTRLDGVDAVETFLATYEWLLQFRDFCRSSGGFQVS